MPQSNCMTDQAFIPISNQSAPSEVLFDFKPTYLRHLYELKTLPIRLLEEKDGKYYIAVTGLKRALLLGEPLPVGAPSYNLSSLSNHSEYFLMNLKLASLKGHSLCLMNKKSETISGLFLYLWISPYISNIYI